MVHRGTVDVKPAFSASREGVPGEEVAEERLVVELGGIREQEVFGVRA